MKETVVVFDGEDEFISHKAEVYDKKKGKAKFANAVGNKAVNQISNEYQENGLGKFQFPSPKDPEFCSIVQNFVRTNGMGIATPDEIVNANELLRVHCTDAAPKDNKPADTPADRPKDEIDPKLLQIEYPNWDSLDCATLESEINRFKNFARTINNAEIVSAINAEIQKGEAINSIKCTVKKPADKPADKPPIDGGSDSPPPSDSRVGSPALPFVPIDVPSLGQPVSGGGGGGGAEDKKSKKYNWLLILLLVAGGLYLASKKSKK